MSEKVIEGEVVGATLELDTLESDNEDELDSVLIDDSDNAFNDDCERNN